jgi:hypothetical protein
LPPLPASWSETSRDLTKLPSLCSAAIHTEWGDGIRRCIWREDNAHTRVCKNGCPWPTDAIRAK